MKKQGKLNKIWGILFHKDKNNNDATYPITDNSELNDNYIFDLKGSYWNGGMQLTETSAEGSSNSSRPPQKISIKPIDILDQVEMPPRVLDLTNLDDKIDVMKRKAEFVKNHYSKREMKGLVECLENRKKYDHIFFGRYSTTTIDHINTLCAKYDLCIREVDLFIPELPTEAVVSMEEYEKKVMEITGKKGIYYVIATASDFKDAYGRRDPILLAQSPFGFYYDILGAWDKEMLILSEL